MDCFSNLPEEISIIILSRMPAKSVGMCRCVSKALRSLLSQPDFIRIHLNLSTTFRNQSVLFSSDVGDSHSLYSAPLCHVHDVLLRNTLKIKKLSKDPLFEIPIFATKIDFANQCDSLTLIHGSCDGLILVGGKEKNKLVLNPVTKEIREVPDLAAALMPTNELAILYGFGYDSVSDDYKIVRVSTRSEFGVSSDVFRFAHKVHIYSLKTGTWKAVENAINKVVIFRDDLGVLVNGCLNWFAFSGSNSNIIMAFNLGEEKFREIKPPLDLSVQCVGVIDECLCLYNLDNRRNIYWVMKEYGMEDSWTKFTVSAYEFDTRLFAYCSVLKSPLCMLGQEELVFLSTNRKSLFIYNLKDTTLKEIVIRSKSVYDSLVPKISFVESLVSPHTTTN